MPAHWVQPCWRMPRLSRNPEVYHEHAEVTVYCKNPSVLIGCNRSCAWVEYHIMLWRRQSHHHSRAETSDEHHGVRPVATDAQDNREGLHGRRIANSNIIKKLTSCLRVHLTATEYQSGASQVQAISLKDLI